MERHGAGTMEWAMRPWGGHGTMEPGGGRGEGGEGGHALNPLKSSDRGSHGAWDHGAGRAEETGTMPWSGKGGGGGGDRSHGAPWSGKGGGGGGVGARSADRVQGREAMGRDGTMEWAMRPMGGGMGPWSWGEGPRGRRGRRGRAYTEQSSDCGPWGMGPWSHGAPWGGKGGGNGDAMEREGGWGGGGGEGGEGGHVLGLFDRVQGRRPWEPWTKPASHESARGMGP